MTIFGIKKALNGRIIDLGWSTIFVDNNTKLWIHGTIGGSWIVYLVPGNKREERVALATVKSVFDAAKKVNEFLEMNNKWKKKYND